jgi:gliding motility-associated lipoprotein GldH
MRNRPFYFIATVIVILLSSCNRGEIFFRFHHIPQGRWRASDAVVFSMDSLNFRLDNKYQVFIELSANNTYPYRDLWLFVEHNLTDTIFSRDTVRFALVDEFGRRLGSGTGGLRQLSMPLLTDIALDTAQVYEIRIAHGMRSNPLRGIEKVGVRVVLVP